MIIDEPIRNSYKLRTNELTISSFEREIRKLEAVKIDDGGNRVYKHLMSHLFLDEAKKIALGLFCVKTKKDDSFFLVNECELSIVDKSKMIELYIKPTFDVKSFYGYGVLISPYHKIREKKTEKFYIYANNIDDKKDINAVIEDFKNHERLLALMLEKNKYHSFNNLGNEAEISLYFDLIFRTYALPKLKAAYSNITSLRFFVQKNKILTHA